MVWCLRAASGRRLSFLLLLLTAAGCAPLRTYGRSQVIAGQCYAEELRRGGSAKLGPGSPVVVTPADSLTRSNEAAVEITCNGGLTR